MDETGDDDAGDSKALRLDNVCRKCFEKTLLWVPRFQDSTDTFFDEESRTKGDSRDISRLRQTYLAVFPSIGMQLDIPLADYRHRFCHGTPPEGKVGSHFWQEEIKDCIELLVTQFKIVLECTDPGQDMITSHVLVHGLPIETRVQLHNKGAHHLETHLVNLVQLSFASDMRILPSHIKSVGEFKQWVGEVISDTDNCDVYWEAYR